MADAAISCDVAIVGAGPAGLAAATELKARGIRSVLVIERAAEAGGVPRHCGHPPFGMREFGRVLRGPDYAARLVARAEAAGAEILRKTDVLSADAGGMLLVTRSEGTAEIAAKRVLLATGVRETPRAARLIGGSRPQGVMTTGALQAMVYLNRQAPFRNPVIVGTELVSFSALLTCRHADIRPAAMIEPGDRPTAWRVSLGLPLAMRVPVFLNTRVVAVEGRERVEAVVVADAKGERRLACDGVLFTGRFTPEASLVRMGHLAFDPASGGPVVDQYGRCSDPSYFAAGNLLRPVETAGWSWREGREVGAAVATDLTDGLPQAERTLTITPVAPVRYALPQTISLPIGRPALPALQLRVARAVSGTLRLRLGSHTVWQRRVSARPEQRLTVPLDPGALRSAKGSLEIGFSEERPEGVLAPQLVGEPPHQIGEEGR